MSLLLLLLLLFLLCQRRNSRKLRRRGQDALGTRGRDARDTFGHGLEARATGISGCIAGATDIQLISSGPWYTEPDGSNNHVVWAQPRVQF
jgi:hypothetical protein